MNSQFVRKKVISGRPAFGLTILTLTITTGCRAHGCSPPKSVIFGPPLIGDGEATGLYSMTATGVRSSVSTAELIMGLVISGSALKAGAGITGASFTTAP